MSDGVEEQEPINGRPLGGCTGKGFKPGQSGNPGGRPRSDVTSLARQHTAEAIAALVAALASPRERVAAAVALLDRGWGKPKHQLEHTGAGGGPIQTQKVVPVDTRPSIESYMAQFRRDQGGRQACGD
jgi:hypothetical protein